MIWSYTFRASATENEGVDGHPCRIFPLGVNDWTLRCRSSEARIRMCQFLFWNRLTDLPFLAQPCSYLDVLVNNTYNNYLNKTPNRRLMHSASRLYTVVCGLFRQL